MQRETIVAFMKQRGVWSQHGEGDAYVARRQRLDASVSAHRGTESARVVAQYVDLLRANGFKREPDVERFLRALWDRVDTLQLRY